MKTRTPDKGFMWTVKQFRNMYKDGPVKDLMQLAADTFELGLYNTLQPIMRDLGSHNTADCDYRKPSAEHVRCLKREARLDGREYDADEAYDELTSCSDCGNTECGIPRLFKLYEELLRHKKRIEKARKK